MKPLKICLIMYGVWFIDFLTTFISLNFLGLVEGNFLPAFFYQFWWGWIVFPILVFAVLFLLSLVISLGYKGIKKQSRFLSKVFLCIGIGTFSLLELTAIINNIYLMINYG